jgi:salicylate hydroxylase
MKAQSHLMSKTFLIVGGGIAGLSAALVLARLGHAVTVLEQASELSEVGAGIQLGPNAMRILQSWGLGKVILDEGCEPASLIVRDARNDQLLTTRRLDDAQQTYGAPYVSIRRAGLQRVLLDAALAAGVDLQLGRRFDAADVSHYDAVLGCDGLHSAVREHVLGGTRHGGKARSTGHTAYRAMLDIAACPSDFQIKSVQVWLDAAQHVVVYPVDASTLNVVIAQSKMPDLADIQSPLLRELIRAVQANGGFSEWPLFDRTPLLSSQHYVKNNMALLGDAAHPMRPYLAQGAAMAIEDAQALGLAIAGLDAAQPSIHPALQAYAQARWQRNATVQIRSQLQGYAFHASGVTRWLRNVVLKVAGERITAMPWLHGYSLQSIA